MHYRIFLIRSGVPEKRVHPRSVVRASLVVSSRLRQDCSLLMLFFDFSTGVFYKILCFVQRTVEPNLCLRIGFSNLSLSVISPYRTKTPIKCSTFWITWQLRCTNAVCALYLQSATYFSKIVRNLCQHSLSLVICWKQSPTLVMSEAKFTTRNGFGK